MTVEGRSLTERHLLLKRNNAVATAYLDAPDRLNLIDADMRRTLAAWYPAQARDPVVYAVILRSAVAGLFATGHDSRELAALAATDLAAARQSVADELALCWRHECFSKPTVSLIDGEVAGAGVGLTLYGTHRVAGEAYAFSMPETAIGLVPGCGVAHAFARMPPGVGSYLSLMGGSVARADALALGLVTHCVSRSDFDAIEAQLAEAEPVDALLDMRHRDPGAGPLTAAAGRIARYFDAPGLGDVLARLAAPEPADREWAAATLAGLRQRSPLALHLTFRAVRAAAGLDIRETLLQDYRLAYRLLAGPDLAEGVRAKLGDQAQTPRWQHARIEEVPPALVDDHFAPLGADELALPTREAMQRGRG